VRSYATTVRVVPALPKPPEEWTVLGDAVRTLRDELDISQKVLADKVGITDAHVSNIEQGKQKNVGLDVLRGFAKFFRLTVDELLADVRLEALDAPLRTLIESGKIAPSYREKKKMVAAAKIVLRPDIRPSTDLDWYQLYLQIRAHHA
jgi:transcriptional regulator with XRE-family HTH domain